MTEIAIPDDAATIELLDQAEQALARVEDIDDAELLFRKLKAVDKAARLAQVSRATRLRAGKLHLRSERRWGELLGPGKAGGDTTGASEKLSDAQYKVRQFARDLAFDVRQDIFDRYLGAVRDPERLRRARLFRLQREWEAQQRRANPDPAYDYEIRHGDFRTALDDLAGQVDAIITDPPYLAEYLDEYDALGEVAARLLKPSGLLVAMVGQMWLPEYLERLGRGGLAYRWCAAYLTPGPARRLHARSFATKWKPLLVFDHGSDRRFLTQDVYTSQGDDKDHHDWGQSESGFADIVQHLTKPGELVVDPFLGGGTTAFVCRELGRSFVGCDIDPVAVQTTRERLASD